MRVIGALEARNKFGTLLDRIERGEEVSITRRGKIVARLIPGSAGFDSAKAHEAVARILARRLGAILDRANMKDLVGEGRQ